MSTVIITGGNLEEGHCWEWLKKQQFDHIIAVDGGLLHSEAIGLFPDYIVGDFDTLPPDMLMAYEKKEGVTIRRFQPEKDDTDTQIAVELAISLEKKLERNLPPSVFEPVPALEKSGRERQEDKTEALENKEFFFSVVVVGAIGCRLDHTLANLFLLEKFENAGILACCMDEHNRISVHSTGFLLQKQQQYGDYVSFLALSETVTGIYLTGFRYPLTDRTLKQEDSLCISNEITEEIAAVSFQKGKLLMIEARD